ncbi:hypothetical protein O181_043317 [Austropuccinia psidii MF-1]|uniref:Uncharacterized protein n=1 Tax=Austropuccinia psidii MF-1 TaxID=1389203 RepID=A0A9Q3DKA8_9BASI|nr:hypothetical protein [Austropuccinia psidii MF-1]
MTGGISISGHMEDDPCKVDVEFSTYTMQGNGLQPGWVYSLSARFLVSQDGDDPVVFYQEKLPIQLIPAKEVTFNKMNHVNAFGLGIVLDKTDIENVHDVNLQGPGIVTTVKHNDWHNNVSSRLHN